MTDDEIIQNWTRFRAVVENRAATAAENPSLAEAIGLKPLPGKKGEIEGDLAPWLRAAATHMLPEAYEWEILTTISGQCFLVLKRYHEPT